MCVAAAIIVSSSLQKQPAPRIMMRRLRCATECVRRPADTRRAGHGKRQGDMQRCSFNVCLGGRLFWLGSARRILLRPYSSAESSPLDFFVFSQLILLKHVGAGVRFASCWCGVVSNLFSGICTFLYHNQVDSFDSTQHQTNYRAPAPPNNIRLDGCGSNQRFSKGSK